jgi:outer membrane immunogenic protein
VIGIEGSVAGADLDSSRKSPFFPTSDTYTADVDLLTTVTGRVGYARDKWLAYTKGGWAGADIELTLFDHGTPVRANSSDWANGWTVGGGGEYSICKNLSPSSIKMIGGSVSLPIPQAWAAEYRSSTATSVFNR